VFVRHISVRFSLDATTGELLWNDPVSGASNEFSAALAAMILKDLLNGEPRYRQMVVTFQGLAGLENDLVVLTNLKAETEQALAAELREAEERAAQLYSKPKNYARPSTTKPRGRLPLPPRRVLTLRTMKKPSPPLQGLKSSPLPGTT
jgi:hypothetical protein